MNNFFHSWVRSFSCLGDSGGIINTQRFEQLAYQQNSLERQTQATIQSRQLLYRRKSRPVAAKVADSIISTVVRSAVGSSRQPDGHQAEKNAAIGSAAPSAWEPNQRRVGRRDSPVKDSLSQPRPVAAASNFDGENFPCLRRTHLFGGLFA